MHLVLVYTSSKIYTYLVLFSDLEIKTSAFIKYTYTFAYAYTYACMCAHINTYRMIDSNYIILYVFWKICSRRAFNYRCGILINYSKAELQTEVHYCSRYRDVYTNDNIICQIL